MKMKYLKKVRSRLDETVELLGDWDRTTELMKRIGGFDRGSDLHNRVEHLKMLLTVDVPSMLTLLEDKARSTYLHHTEAIEGDRNDDQE